MANGVSSRVVSGLRFGLLAFACVILPSEALPAPTPPISFELRTIKGTYLVGEPVVIILTQTGSAQMYNEGWEDLWRQDTHFRLLVNRGQGFTRLRRKRLHTGGAGWGDLKVQKEDGTRGECVLSYDESIGDCASGLRVYFDATTRAASVPATFQP